MNIYSNYLFRWQPGQQNQEGELLETTLPYNTLNFRQPIFIQSILTYNEGTQS